MAKSSKPKPPKPPKPERPSKRKRSSKKAQTSYSLSLPAVQLPETDNQKIEKPAPKEQKTPPGEREAARARVMRVLAEDIDEHGERGEKGGKTEA
jgi:hypothetical protein